MQESTIESEPRPGAPIRSFRFWLLLAISTLVLTPSFVFNTYGVVGQRWFERHQTVNEGWVIGRMAIAAEDGLFSHGGFVGDAISEGFSRYKQRDAYLAHATIKRFETYESMNGLQGVLFALFEVGTDLPRERKLEVLNFVNGLMAAMGLSIVIAWLGREWGLAAFAISLGATVFSPHLLVFGRNLFWVLWAFFIPFAAVLWVCDRDAARRPIREWGIALAVTGAVLSKCLLTGYEYMTTALVMMLVPFVHAAALHRWPLGKCIRLGGLISIAGLAGMMLSMGILVLQIAGNQGGIGRGFEHIVDSVGRRTHGSVEDFGKDYEPSLNASVSEVLARYLPGTALGHARLADGLRPDRLETAGRITFRDLLIVFAGVSIIALALVRWARGREDDWDSWPLVVLVIVTWFSFLAPMSWLVIFKSHSYIHTHMNFLSFYLPFMSVAFALCGATAAALVAAMRRRSRSASVGSGT